jgi:hypothetical protein
MGNRVARPELVRMLFVIPSDIRMWIEEKAAFSLSPMNSVVVAALRQQMDAERQEKSVRAERASVAVD